MTGPSRTVRERPQVQPPRPPNAWILYRSDKLRQLPQIAPHQRLAQADVSRLISNMWKNETEDVRLDYERRADAKKAEHALKYPNYRYQPQTKEQKQRARVQKKQDRQDKKQQPTTSDGDSPAADSSAVTSSTPSPAPPLLQGLLYTAPPFAIPGFYVPDIRFGPGGPSPPLSAAASPVLSPLPELLPSPVLRPASVPLKPEYRTDGDASSVTSLPTTPYTHALSPPATHSRGTSEPAPYTTDVNIQQTCQRVSKSTVPQAVATPATVLWAPTLKPESKMDETSTDTTSASEFVFNLSEDAFNSMQSWLEQTTPTFGDTIQSLLSCTGNQSIFQLNDFDPDTLTSNPTGEIEVLFNPLDELHEFSSASGSVNLSNFCTNPLPAVSMSNNFLSFFPDLPSNPQTDFANYNAEDYLNFDGLVASEEMPQHVPNERHFSARLTPQQSPTAPPSKTHSSDSSTASTPYVPPSGAPFSSTRRVAGSWKPPFEIADSPIDGPPRPWGVPAN